MSIDWDQVLGEKAEDKADKGEKGKKGKGEKGKKGKEAKPTKSVASTSELPLAPFRKLMLKQGIQLTSKEAVEKVRQLVIKDVKEIITRAIKLRNHAGRKILAKEDLTIAIREYMGVSSPYWDD